MIEKTLSNPSFLAQPEDIFFTKMHKHYGLPGEMLSICLHERVTSE